MVQGELTMVDGLLYPILSFVLSAGSRWHPALWQEVASGFFGEVASGKLQEIPPKFRRWCHLKSIVVVILVSSLVGKWQLVFTRKFPWSIEQPKIWMGAIQVDVVGQGINKAGNPSYKEVSSWATDLKKRWIFHCPVWLPDGIVHYISLFGP